ncbi:hypothetical protein REPUB_Repub01dG0141000 [Reevesia pubescens]
MKMEREDFGSSFGSPTHHNPPHSYPAASTPNSHDEPNLFSSSIFNFNDANLIQQPLLPHLIPFQSDDPSCFNFFTQHHLPSDNLHLPQLLQPPDHHDDLHFSLYSSSLPALLPPKIPHPHILPHDSSGTDFHHSFSKPLPELHFLQQPRLPACSSSSSSTRKLKRTRLDLNLCDSTANNNPQTLHSIVQSFNSPPIIPHSELARKRRQTLSDKTRSLQKLMPWDKKMDTGTMLQEAYKYIRFLQAQVFILQSMPITSSFASTQLDYAGLGRLNRQQLLQVLVNSPVAQTMLSSHGFCVFASEQLVSLNKAKERNTVLQRFLFGN